MTAAEIAAAKEAIKRAGAAARRSAHPPAGAGSARPRASICAARLRASMKSGGDLIDLRFIGPTTQAAADRRAARYFRLDEPVQPALPPFPACCDRRAKARVTPSCSAPGSPTSPARCAHATRTTRWPPVRRAVPDWSGGTRIATSLHDFNKHWARRVLGQGAIVLLITDGLERDADDRAGVRDRPAAPLLPAADLAQSAVAL